MNIDTSSDISVTSFEPKRIIAYNGHQWINPKLSPTILSDQLKATEKIIGLKTASDVANILEIPVGQLLYILYQQNKKYTSFTIKKKSGKERLIEKPNNSLQILQSKIKPLIEAHYRVKKPVHGFVSGGKGIVSNAEQHKKKNFILNIDLLDFFHSINFGRVQGIFRNIPFNMDVPAATILAQLCTYNGRLPQGASTSPIISNLAAATLDKKLVQIAKRFHLTYTRYADDITFSSNREFPAAIVQRDINTQDKLKYIVGPLLERAITDSGFHINHNKTRVQRKCQRQEVTGLVVNNGVNINRQLIRNTRAMINEWRKDLQSAEIRFIKHRYHVTENDIEINKLDGSIYKRAIYGKLSFIKMVRGEDHSPYLKLCKQVLELDSNPPPFIKKLKGVFDMYDVFICHASEDKNRVAIPLYHALEEKGIKTFLDCFAIGWGDSLVGKINTALQKSKFVISIISEASIDKSWPMKEIHTVLSMEIRNTKTKLLPLIVGNERTIIEKLPLIADKRYISFKNNVDEIVDEMDKLLKNSTI